MGMNRGGGAPVGLTDRFRRQQMNQRMAQPTGMAPPGRAQVAPRMAQQQALAQQMRGAGARGRPMPPSRIGGPPNPTGGRVPMGGRGGRMYR